VVYDIALFLMFRHVVAEEERGRGASGEQ
jgi:hypothetical protein